VNGEWTITPYRVTGEVLIASDNDNMRTWSVYGPRIVTLKLQWFGVEMMHTTGHCDCDIAE